MVTIVSLRYIFHHCSVQYYWVYKLCGSSTTVFHLSNRQVPNTGQWHLYNKYALQFLYNIFISWTQLDHFLNKGKVIQIKIVTHNYNALRLLCCRCLLSMSRRRWTRVQIQPYHRGGNHGMPCWNWYMLGKIAWAFSFCFCFLAPFIQANWTCSSFEKSKLTKFIFVVGTNIIIHAIGRGYCV